MAAALTTDIQISGSARLSFALDKGSAKEVHDIVTSLQWPSGTSDSQADMVWSDSRTVNAAANDDLELDNLTQVDDAGATVRSVSFAVVKGIIIRNTSSADRIDIGGVGATAFAGSGDYPLQADDDVAQCSAGGTYVWIVPGGGAVTNGATDILRISGITSNQTYDIWIIGEST
jgi:hypothetical protein